MAEKKTIKCPTFDSKIGLHCPGELQKYRETTEEQQKRGLPKIIYSCGVCGFRGMLTEQGREFVLHGRRFNE